MPPLTPDEHQRQRANADRREAARKEPDRRTAEAARAEGAEALGRPELAHIDLIEDIRRRGLAYHEQRRQEAAAARGEQEPDRSSGYDRC